MANDSSDRLDRLAERAKKLDEVIQRAAEMQKRIVEEIRQIGKNDKISRQRMSATPQPRRTRRRRARKR